MYVCVGYHASMNSDTSTGQKKISDPLETVRDSCKLVTWILGIEIRSSGIPLKTLNCLTISSSLLKTFEKATGKSTIVIVSFKTSLNGVILNRDNVFTRQYRVPNKQPNTRN